MSDARKSALRELKTQNKLPHVGIVGAGISGLRCADTLIRNGFEVTIFEARERIGGRVFQQEIGGHAVDMGANWIHGTSNNPIALLASMTDTDIVPDEPDSIFFDSAGERIPKDKADPCAEVVAGALKKAIEHSKKRSSSIDPQTSVLDYVLEIVRQSHLNAESKIICEQMIHMYNSEIGDCIASQSLKYFHLEDGMDGNDAFVASTYKNIMQLIGKAARSADAIQLGQEVVQVQTLSRNSDKKAVAIELAGGQVKTFDEVVITCPLGWLKRHKSAFTPSLPPRLEQAIDSIGYSALEKVFVSFPTAFWKEAKDRRDAAPSTLVASDEASRFIFWHFLSPSYHPLTKHLGSWTQEFVALSGLPAAHAHPTLVFYVAPPCSRHLMPSFAGLAPHSDAYNATLRSFTEPFYSRMPNYSAASPACRPTLFLGSQWQNDPFAGYGSYVSFQVGLERADEDLEILRSGGGRGTTGGNLMGNDRGVWFAGEHTAPLCGLGTTTGAWWSGERAARDILEVYGMKKDMKKDGIEPVIS
ncbi:flavin containing amine oxidase, putative [Metarhizium acridum CQMa 102]|uniref:Flavin containing amine oxidase, putative n=1 Tax=Metarhizium acridum (strain CQMa 102) TaxID=655827 RepID=E9EFN8_METAQ|nr:flavin containing amine oxidase, putative [Metarhizium acridum CQMa 102]EFY85276.1 flavin containing amine oxidase, putative [Metarhizium acridum CQMa 102]